MQLLMIADDFTGALDTGVQFVKAGARAEVFFDGSLSFGSHPDTEVFIVDTESRHLPADEAYRKVFTLVKEAKASGITHFYKKTDSALRGNVGPEIIALSDALQSPVVFAPAHPKMGRIVKDGMLFVDGVPVHESVFGRDPFDPVKSAKVADLFGEKLSAVRIMDAKSTEDLDFIAENMIKDGTEKAVAGCAGFAESYVKIFRFQQNEEPEKTLNAPVLTVCGSINEISVRQVKNAEENGFSTRTLETPVDEICRVLKEKGSCILENVEGSTEALRENTEEKRQKIVRLFGQKTRAVLQDNQTEDLIVIGGDTLHAVLKTLESKSIRILRELPGGAVLFETRLKDRTLRIVSKSGGFGQEEWLTDRLKEVVKE